MAKRVGAPVQREEGVVGEGGGEGGVGGGVHVQPAVVHAFWLVFVSQTGPEQKPLMPGVQPVIVCTLKVREMKARGVKVREMALEL